jgi:hypothetical protein
LDSIEYPRAAKLVEGATPDVLWNTRTIRAAGTLAVVRAQDPRRVD